MNDIVECVHILFGFGLYMSEFNKKNEQNGLYQHSLCLFWHMQMRFEVTVLA